MEMEFKDNSRRRTMVLVVGVLLALGAGVAAFMLSSQSTDEPETVFPTRDIVVAARPIAARQTIDSLDLAVRQVPIDETNAAAYSSRDAVANRVAAIPILEFQPITENMLATSKTGNIQILRSGETISPESPIMRAVSLTVPNDRAVAGLVGDGQRVDLIATLPIAVALAVDPDTGVATANDPETGEPFPYVEGSSTKLMWLDVEIITRPPDTDTYVIRTDLQTAEEIAHAQNQGAQFTMALRPGTDTRDVDRSTYGETTDAMVARYNFRIPEAISGESYPQPIAFPSPFPNEPYLSPPPSPSPSPESALIELPAVPEESPQP